MKYLDVLIDVPCFKCLFCEPIKESHLHCNPNECQKLTEWLDRIAQRKKGEKERVSFLNLHEEAPDKQLSTQSNQ